MISAMNSSLSALSAFARKQESVAANTANVNTDGFKKTRTTIESDVAGTVRPQVSRVDTPGPLAYEQSPDGYQLVEKSNVDIAEEMPEAMLNNRFYQANLKVLQVSGDMMGSLLDVKG
jgi:flagellar basal body rod protein FlgG